MRERNKKRNGLRRARKGLCEPRLGREKRQGLPIKREPDEEKENKEDEGYGRETNKQTKRYDRNRLATHLGGTSRRKRTRGLSLAPRHLSHAQVSVGACGESMPWAQCSLVIMDGKCIRFPARGTKNHRALV